MLRLRVKLVDVTDFVVFGVSVTNYSFPKDFSFTYFGGNLLFGT
jgi:hypothetical protein